MHTRTMAHTQAGTNAGTHAGRQVQREGSRHTRTDTHTQAGRQARTQESRQAGLGPSMLSYLLALSTKCYVNVKHFLVTSVSQKSQVKSCNGNQKCLLTGK